MPSQTNQQARTLARLDQDSASTAVQRRANGHDVRGQLASNAQFKQKMIAQMRGQPGEEDTSAVLASAAQGVQGSGGALPYLDTIQKSFGHHNVGSVQAYVGGQAKTASDAIGAEAYATGNSVAFGRSPTLHTAAHEAAHIVQQRAGVQLSGGVGQVGDKYECHADAVADRVVQGKSAADLLDQFTGMKAPADAGVQRKEAVQRNPMHPTQVPPVTGDVRRPARGRLLGEVMHGPAGSELRVTVSSHSTDGWRQFLRKYASSSSEAPKLVMFMALAIGRRHLNVDDGSSLSLRGMSPVTEMEALALMEAFLSVGPGINLADSTLERPGGTGGAVVVHTGPIMAAFNGRFAATALERMTRREKRFGPRQVANVTAYAGDASGMKDHADDNLGGQTQDPVQSLIASSFGAAASAAAGWIRYEEKDDRRESRHCAKLLFNSAVVINGCLAQIEADAAARKALFMTIFKGAVGATAGALVGPLAGAVFGAFAPAAEQLFEFCMSGDSTKQRAETIHAFRLAIDELGDNWGLKAAQGTEVTGVFQDGLS